MNEDMNVGCNDGVTKSLDQQALVALTLIEASNISLMISRGEKARAIRKEWQGLTAYIAKERYGDAFGLQVKMKQLCSTDRLSY